MIKILFFIEQLTGGGAEKVLRNLVNEMDQSKFDITVQSLWMEDARLLLAPGIKYKYCYRSSGKIAYYRYRLEAGSGLLYPFYIKGAYDIEVAFLECGATKIIASAAHPNVKTVAWVHCDLANKMKYMADPGGFLRKSTRWYQHCDRIVCVSQTVRDCFHRLFGMENKTVVLYNTIDDAAIREKSLLELPNGLRKRRFTALSAGRLGQEKGYDRLLRIYRDLLTQGFAFDLWILGDGKQRLTLERFIEDNQLQDSVKLLGFDPNPYPYMRIADLLVSSSYYEGFSTFVAEGLILGKPIIATECSGMRELLGDSEYGLITENSEDGLYRGMKQMLEDDSLREVYTRRSLARGADFSAEQLTKETEQFLLNTVED